LLVRRVQDQDMKTKTETRLAHACDLGTNVHVERIDTDLSVEDAQKLNSVKEASRRGDLKTAARPQRVFRLTPAN